MPLPPNVQIQNFPHTKTLTIGSFPSLNMRLYERMWVRSQRSPKYMCEFRLGFISYIKIKIKIKHAPLVRTNSQLTRNTALTNSKESTSDN
jgi:hypothetical protein